MLKISKLCLLSLTMIIVLAACGSAETENNSAVTTLEDLANAITEQINESEAVTDEATEEEVFELSPEEYVGSSLEELIPTFQEIITTVETPLVEYDFDGDGIDDIAVVLEDTEIQAGNEDIQRTLLVALGMGDGTYHFPDYFDNIVYGPNDGGVMGDPFVGLSLDEEFGTLGVSHYGGSNYRWSNTYHIAYREQGWTLVAYSGENFNASDLSSEIIEIDLALGDAYYEVIDGDGNSQMYFPSAPPHQDILLYDFNDEVFSEFISSLMVPN